MAIRKSMEEVLVVAGERDEWLTRCAKGLMAAGFKDVQTGMVLGQVAGPYRKYPTWGELKNPGLWMFAILAAAAGVARGYWMEIDIDHSWSLIRLRNAIDGFSGLGILPWAERARRELRASGETARKRDVTTIDDLTPQERRIAELVATGASNREVAAQLFVSPKPVAYHLAKVFTKIGVASRVELAKIPLGTADVRVSL